jgi:putative tryptophan/tyrosine transport system substrate-binding protein
VKKAAVTSFLVAVTLLAGAVLAEAQQPAKKVARIGYLSPQCGPLRSPTLETFKEGLRGLGWVERKQIEFEYRYAGGNLDKLSDFATELVRIKVDVIVAGPGNAPTNSAKRATTTIPIVIVGVADPISEGLVASLARPGANVTGLTYEVTREQAGKNLELLKEAVPKVSRVAILRNPNDSTHTLYSKEADRAAKILGVTIQFAEVQARNDKDLEDVLGAAINERANALLVTPYSFFVDRRQQIIDFVARHKLPAIYSSIGFVNDGGLMVYGPDQLYMWRRAATYVDKILKGTKPADLPVEQPMKFELVINLKAAKQIGVTISPNVLARADRVIKEGAGIKPAWSSG